eukprot:scaffold2140_cov394-Prasinococcus_capsulatus_cf.AAC.20
MLVAVRYIKEWTLGMAAIKMLAYDEATDTFSLPPHVKLVVEDPVGAWCTYCRRRVRRRLVVPMAGVKHSGS